MDFDVVLENRKSARRRLIDPFCDKAQYKDFIAYMDQKTLIRPEIVHYYRYASTFKNMLNCFGEIRGKTIVETGSLSPISGYLAKYGNSVYGTKSDLRICIDKTDNFADIVFSFEVIEHIKDQPEDSFEKVVLFQRDGAEQYAKEIDRILKPGGVLFLTTPNACSASAIANAISGRPPMIFAQHVREYTQAEIRDIFSGFEIVVESTQDVFFLNPKYADQVRNLFVELGISNARQGDDHFYCLRKRFQL